MVTKLSHGMGCRIWNIKSLALCILVTFLLGCFIALSPITTGTISVVLKNLYFTN